MGLDAKLCVELAKGTASYIPGVNSLESRARRLLRHRVTGRASSGRYCYSVWLRHLVMLRENGYSTPPDVVAELGPGDSLGIGLAALLSGSSRYYGLDVMRYIGNQRNLRVLDELVELFRKREDIPGEAEFPRVEPYLKSYTFPNHILTKDLMSEALKPERIAAIRRALLSLNQDNSDGIQLSYFVPWHETSVMMDESMDLIYSQATLEHVEDLEHTYGAMYRWLKPGGIMSHTIDFKCHGLAKEWNGHWTYHDLVWRVIMGNRPWLINRQPHSAHIDAIRKARFQLICDSRVRAESGVQRQQLASRFRSICDDDLTTSVAFIQAVKGS